MTDFSLPVKFAHDCAPCPDCGEPFCHECGEHYADCAHPGPHSEPDDGGPFLSDSNIPPEELKCVQCGEYTVPVDLDAERRCQPCNWQNEGRCRSCGSSVDWPDERCAGCWKEIMDDEKYEKWRDQ